MTSVKLAASEEAETKSGSATSPGAVSLAVTADGQMWAHRGDESAAVWVYRCFPWSDGTRFVSLRNQDEEEFCLVREPAALDEGSREVLETKMVEAGFVLEITRIDEVEEEVEIRTWRVETKQGPRRFQTQRDEWPREVPGGGLVVRDVGGDLFWIPAPAQLDEKSRKNIWAFVD